MNENVKIALAAVGAFAVAVSADIVSRAIYTNTKIGTDKKVLIAAGVLGIGTTLFMVKVLKKRMV